VSDFKHFRINQSPELAQGLNHLNGIENLCNQSTRVLRKYDGINKKYFHVFLKECEVRFNYRAPSEQLKILQKWCVI